jgi:hypothetical protein
MIVKWIGETRATAFGTFRAGDMPDLPRDDALSLIDQGLATRTRGKTTTKPETGKADKKEE